MDLAGAFGLEFNRDARKKLQIACRKAKLKGVSFDSESDFVSIRSGRDAIVGVAVLINLLSTPSLQVKLSDASIKKVRHQVLTHKVPPRSRWKVGDVFACPLLDGSFAFGQVLWESEPVSRQGIRAPLCSLHDLKTSLASVNLSAILKTRVVSILQTLGEELDSGRWRIIGSAVVRRNPFNGPCGRPGEVGSQSWDGYETLANAWFGLTPWNPDGDDFLDEWLLRGVRRPSKRKILKQPRLRHRKSIR